MHPGFQEFLGMFYFRIRIDLEIFWDATNFLVCSENFKSDALSGIT